MMYVRVPWREASLLRVKVVAFAYKSVRVSLKTNTSRYNVYDLGISWYATFEALCTGPYMYIAGNNPSSYYKRGGRHLY